MNKMDESRQQKRSSIFNRKSQPPNQHALNASGEGTLITLITRTPKHRKKTIALKIYTPPPLPISLNNLPPQPTPPPPHPLPPSSPPNPPQRTPPPTPPRTLPLQPPPKPRRLRAPPTRHHPAPHNPTSPPSLQRLNLFLFTTTHPFPFLHHRLQRPHLPPRLRDRVIAVQRRQPRRFARGLARRGREVRFQRADLRGEFGGRGGGGLVGRAREIEVRGQGRDLARQGLVRREGVAGAGFGGGDARHVRVGVRGREEVVARALEVGGDLRFGRAEGGDFGGLGGLFVAGGCEGGFEVGVLEV